MRRRITMLLAACLVWMGTLSGCGENSQQTESAKNGIKPDISHIRSICELATLECYYHNVAQSVKEPGTGIKHVFEKERKFWIQYTGTIKLGIDMSEVKMNIEDNKVEITMPEAKILAVTVDTDSYNEDSFIKEEPGFFNENVITAADAEGAIADATETMRKETLENKSLMVSAQTRAKKLIENYIDMLGDESGVDYDIRWVDAASAEE